MTLVSDLIKFIFSQDPKQNASRLTFYYYLNNCLPPSAPLKLEHVESFFFQSLCFQTWQDNKAALAAQIIKDLQLFGERHSLEFSLAELSPFENLQIIPISNGLDALDILQNQRRAQLTSSDKLRTLPTGQTRVTALKLDFNLCLEVKSYPHIATIIDGHLRLLGPVTSLSYDENMDLLPNTQHALEVSPFKTALFTYNAQNFSGCILQGQNFQKLEAIKGELINHLETFCSLKKLERYYIRRESDPFYQELVSLLERSSHLLKNNKFEGPQLATEALRRGQMALTNIFPEDKLIQFLVNSLNCLIQRSRLSQSPNISKSTINSVDI